MRQVTPSQYVDLLNEALRREKGFEEGMRFFIHPQGSTDDTMRGIGFEGPPSGFLLAAHVQTHISQGVRFR
ncbi:hypothetical protein D9M72_630640 [compost metagenome]